VSKPLTMSEAAEALRVSKRHAVDIDFLRECFSYDPITGVMRWKERPATHFQDQHRCRIANSRWAGKIAGRPEKKGYLAVAMTIEGRGRICLKLHRIIFAMHHGRWPEDQLDHINRDPSDNRLENLREATNAENCQNRRKRSDNTSGLVGVSFDKKVGRWRSYIGADGRLIHLGFFDSPAEAGNAYDKARAVFHVSTGGQHG
jgi:hypothetical protein